MNRLLLHVALVVAAVAGAWALTGGTVRLKTKVDLGVGDEGEASVKHSSPTSYGSPCPAAGIPTPITGRHPLFRHPRRCSPHMSAVMANNLDWMFCPPSEEDL
jgi:hypothetical protein